MYKNELCVTPAEPIRVRVGRGSRHDPDAHGFAFLARKARSLSFRRAKRASFFRRAKRAETLDSICVFSAREARGHFVRRAKRAVFLRRAKRAKKKHGALSAHFRRAKRASIFSAREARRNAQLDLRLFDLRSALASFGARSAQAFFGARSAPKRSTRFTCLRRAKRAFFFRRAKRAGNLWRAKRASIFSAREARRNAQLDLRFIRLAKRAGIFRRAKRAGIFSAREASRSARLDLRFSLGGSRRLWAGRGRVAAARRQIHKSYIRCARKCVCARSALVFFGARSASKRSTRFASSSVWVASALGGSRVGRGGPPPNK